MDEKKNKKHDKHENVESKTENKSFDEKKQAEEKVSKESEYLELAQRITAEFENYKKRNADLAQKSEEEGVVRAVQKILPIVDSFDNAFKMVKDEGSKEGLRLVYEIVINALGELGVTEIDAVGKDFDPQLHNAVIATEDEKNAGKVLEVYQKGFKMGDRVIRYSMVRVGK